jgi:hypothetical protein
MLKTDPSMSHQTNKNAVTSPRLDSFFLSMNFSLIWSLLNQLLVESIVEKEKISATESKRAGGNADLTLDYLIAGGGTL